MSKAKYYTDVHPIPTGFQIYEDRIDVAGVNHRIKNAKSFVKGKGQRIEFETDPSNKYDSNAIRILGFHKGFFGEKKEFIGYVPTEVAAQIMEGNYFNKIKPRLLKTYMSDSGFIEILFQVLGPKSGKKEYQQSSELEHAT